MTAESKEQTQPKRGKGAPKGPRANWTKRDNMVPVYVSDSEKQRLQQKAQESGAVSVSDYIRRACLS